MDVLTPTTGSRERDPKGELLEDVDKVRAERDDIERQISADREKLAGIRSALDGTVTSVWRDVSRQYLALRDKDNIVAAFTFGWLHGMQWTAIVALLILAGGGIYAFSYIGGVIVAVVYCVLAAIGYFVARDQSMAPLKKARESYLNDNGKDLRFVAFTRYEPSLQHPLIGFDGPVGGMLEDRAWKIPGVRGKDALDETFVELIDERRSNVLLTRFPERKPTLVHADMENPFIRSYGVMFQRALERHMEKVRSQAEEYREIVAHMGARKEIDERVRRMEAELADFDGTAAIMRSMPLSMAARNRLLRRVVLFRMGDPSARRGLFIVAGDANMEDVIQTLSRASAATLMKLSFADMKIGYVGQGAANISRTFAAAKRARSIIYLDEAERFFSASGSAVYESMRREIVAAIMEEWEHLDGSDVWLIASSKTREGLEEGVVARFGAVLDLTSARGAREDHESPTENIDLPPPSVVGEETDAEPVALSDAVAKRAHMLAAMFAHCDAMEAQAVAVPRAVLITGSSGRTTHAFIDSVVAQSSLPFFAANIDDLDSTMRETRSERRSIVAVAIPEFGAPGSIAHLAVLIDELNATKTQTFILATAHSQEELDPELRTRFSEIVDLTELGGPERRAKLSELLEARKLDFELAPALEALESHTDGMTSEQLHHFVDEAARKAVLRAIEAGAPDASAITLADFEGSLHDAQAQPDATKADEAAL